MCVNELSTRRLSIIAMLCLSLLTAVIACKKQSIVISVTNSGQQTIHSVKIAYNGGEYVIKQLQPNETQQQAIAPKGSSALKIDFKDAEGKYISSDIDVYIEKDYSGRIDIVIVNNKISLSDKTVIPLQ